MAINVATGNVHLEYEDVSIPGQVILLWDRRYRADLRLQPPGMLGPSWTCRYLTTLTRNADGFEFLTPSGLTESFSDPEHSVERGATIRLLGSFLELFQEHDRYVVQEWDVDTGDVVRYCFSQHVSGVVMRLTSVEDVTGQGLDTEWSIDGRLVAIYQRLERRRLVLDYFTDGLIRSVTLVAPDGGSSLRARYEYDENRRLAAAFDPLDNADRFEYDSKGMLTRELSVTGGVISYRYDDKGRCVRSSGQEGFDEKRLRFHDAILVTEVTDSYGAVTRYKYLPTGQIVSEWNPLGAQTATSYDVHGRITAKTAPTGATTRYGYDDNGNTCEIVDPLGHTHVMAFNDLHQPVSLQEPGGAVWQRDYNAKHRLARTADPLGRQWTLNYDEEGNLVSYTNPKGNSRLHSYKRGVPTARTDWAGNTTNLEYDECGRLTKQIDPLGHATRYVYDPAGNLLQLVRPNGATTRMEYNASGDLVRLVDPEGRTTTIRYGYCRRRLQVIDANGGSVRYVWGTEPGRLDAIVNERGELYQFIYDEAGNCISEIGFDGRTLRFTCDADGHRNGILNGAGESIALELDPLGRVVGYVGQRGLAAQFKYDSMGRLVSAVNPDCAISLERDALGQLRREVRQTPRGEHWVSYTVDELGDLTGMNTDLGMQVTYRLDQNGLVSSLHARAGESIYFTRDAGQQETQRVLPGDVVLSQQYDPNGLIIDQQVSHRNGTSSSVWNPANWSSGSTTVHRRYGRDRWGLVTEIDDQFHGLAHFDYDPAERLTRVLRDPGASEQFAYDETGNLTQVETEIADVIRRRLIYGPGSRVQRNGESYYQHDGQGRLTHKVEAADASDLRVWMYGWDGLDQLRSVTTPDGEVWQYQYDALGRRIGKSGDAGWVEFLWANDWLVHEMPAGGAEWTGWIYETGSFSPVAQFGKNDFASIITDHLGTPRELIDVSGVVTRLPPESAYGEPPAEARAGDACPVRFPGQYEDAESGLRYSRFRYYEPELGAFISQDPIRLFGGVNLYAYTTDPINQSDPFGLSTSSDSKKLGNNLVNDTPPQRPAAPGHEDAHHIVMSNSQHPGMAAVRTTMETVHGIDVNDPRNGIWLPRNDDARKKLPASDLRTLHGGEGVHSDAYKQHVVDTLTAPPQPGTKKTFLARLKKLKDELKSGKTFPCKG